MQYKQQIWYSLRDRIVWFVVDQPVIYRLTKHSHDTNIRLTRLCGGLCFSRTHQESSFPAFIQSFSLNPRFTCWSCVAGWSGVLDGVEWSWAAIVLCGFCKPNSQLLQLANNEFPLGFKYINIYLYIEWITIYTECERDYILAVSIEYIVLCCLLKILLEFIVRK